MRERRKRKQGKVKSAGPSERLEDSGEHMEMFQQEKNQWRDNGNEGHGRLKMRKGTRNEERKELSSEPACVTFSEGSREENIFSYKSIDNP